LSQKKEDEIVIRPTPTHYSSPTPNKILSHELSDEINNYINSLSTIGTYNKDLKPPNLSLEVNF